ncbi:hypothetical protein DERF_005063 [Dermatophagoides farinae]|uniref:Uncharacterized protein n=1 Tax=Dermatophagoides farinae TaxID=6954 RepID=A0A922I3K5_DERFA|nr:hypothetical protein DERF_005063 [Dermatophagoides farinae]
MGVLVDVAGGIKLAVDARNCAGLGVAVLVLALLLVDWIFALGLVIGNGRPIISTIHELLSENNI